MAFGMFVIFCAIHFLDRHSPAMKNSLVLSGLCFCFGAVAIGLAQDSKPVFLAGAAAVDISPREFPVNMPGGFNANLATAVHDPLYARSIALSDGTTTVVMVVVDNLGVAAEVVEEAKALALKEAGVAVEHILIGSTHTHSAPASNVREGAAPDIAYRKQLVKGIADSIGGAIKQLRPALAGTASHTLPEEVFNRRWFLKPGQMKPNPFGQMDRVKMNPGTSDAILERPAGPTDPEVTILSLQDAASGKPLALLANYSLHYVGATPPGQVSADYFGEFCRLMPSRLRAGDEFVAMLSNGASGDINNIPFRVTRPPRETFEQVRIVAQKTADTVWFAFGKIERHEAVVALGMRERWITLQLRKPDAEQIAYAKLVLAAPETERSVSFPPLAEAYARRTLALAEAGESIKIPLQVVRVGDLAVCAIPFETLVEIGLELKEKSPFSETMVIGIANGYNGYLPTPEQHRLGGYETWLGTNKVQEDASVLIVENLLAMMKELHEAKPPAKAE
jgi:neutral ceramidase